MIPARIKARATNKQNIHKPNIEDTQLQGRRSFISIETPANVNIVPKTDDALDVL